MPRQTVSQTISSLLERHHLMTAPQLLEHLHAQGLAVNKTSVYRAIDKLLESGKLCKHNLHDNEIAYELRGHHHDHLVCEQCGKILSMECHFDAPPMKEGFKISHHHITLYGLCSDCQT